MEPIPNHKDTHFLAQWVGDRGEHLYGLKISYETDSTYLLAASIEDEEPSFVLEFTANSDVLDIRDKTNPKLLGRIFTPPGYKFGRALKFSPYKTDSVDQPIISILYEGPGVEMFIEFEKLICKLITVHNDSQVPLLDSFLSGDWKAVKAANPNHPKLIITFTEGKQPLN
jgi:hypothetical protein